MEPVLSGLSNYLHAQMSMWEKPANQEMFILSYSVYFFTIQSLHLLFLRVFCFVFFYIWCDCKSSETNKCHSWGL